MGAAPGRSARAAVFGAAGLLSAAALWLCVGHGPLGVDPSDPPQAHQAACAALVATTPDRLPLVFVPVAGPAPFDHRLVVAPASPYTAAWGSPVVVLRCGAPAVQAADGCTELDDRAWFHDPLQVERWTTRTQPVLEVTARGTDRDSSQNALSAVAAALPPPSPGSGLSAVRCPLPSPGR